MCWAAGLIRVFVCAGHLIHGVGECALLWLMVCICSGCKDMNSENAGDKGGDKRPPSNHQVFVYSIYHNGISDISFFSFLFFSF